MDSRDLPGPADAIDEGIASGVSPAPDDWGALFDVFTEGVAVCTLDGRLLYENAALANMCDTDPENARVRYGICALARDAAEMPAEEQESRRADGDAIATRTVRTSAGRYFLRAAALRTAALFGAPVTLVSAERVQGGLPSLDQLRARFALTLAEARIVPLLAARRTNTQIAHALGISPHTVRHHAEKAFLKLCVHRRSEIAERLSRFICV